MEWYGFLITVGNASVAVVVLQILYDEFLSNVDDTIEIFVNKVKQFNCELVWANPKNFTFLIELKSCYRASVIFYLMESVNLPFSRQFFKSKNFQERVLGYC